MIRSSLAKFVVIPEANPSQSQSPSADQETPQVINSSDGELSNSEQEGPDSGTPELNQLMLSYSGGANGL